MLPSVEQILAQLDVAKVSIVVGSVVRDVKLSCKGLGSCEARKHAPDPTFHPGNESSVK